MAISTTSTLPAIQAVPITAFGRVGAKRRRRISPQTGHALEILGHAIEYLADEYVHEGGSFQQRDPQMQAIEMLMAINREVYFSCPEVPSLADRWRSWLQI